MTPAHIAIGLLFAVVRAIAARIQYVVIAVALSVATIAG
jgi:hypothetical protein